MRALIPLSVFVRSGTGARVSFDFESPLIEAALHDGATLFAHTESGTAGPARFVGVWSGDELLACAAESGLTAAVSALETELRDGGPLTPAVRQWLADGFALKCFFPYACAVAGDSVAANALDELLLSGRAFEVQRAEVALRFRATWTTALGTPLELARRVITERVSITWLHGDWLFRTDPLPYRGKRAGEWYARTETLLRPNTETRRRPYPTHRAEVTATGPNLGAALRAAVPAVAEALAGEAEWRAAYEIVRSGPLPTDSP